MRLRVTTPLDVVVDETGVVAARAQDASGGFGMLPHHADFLTRLEISVLSWQRADGARAYCAVRGGVLTVHGGETITVATREAIRGDDLATLDREVLHRFRNEAELEQVAFVHATQLQLNAIRQIMRHLRPVRGGSDFA